MTPGSDPLDPLELALLMEAAGDLAGPEDKDTPPGGEAGDGGGQDDQES
jgi:hypothetical protein